MDPFDYWRLCEELSVFQAAMLIAGEDPSGDAAELENWPINQRPKGYEAAKQAISRAIIKSKVEGDIVQEMEYNEDGIFIGYMDGTVDVHQTSVNVESLRSWLRERGFTTGFFFPSSSNSAAYLDSENPNFAPKLAAAVRAWEAVTTDPKYLDNGKHVKQNLVSWLTSHAAALELLKPDGEINVDAIENQVAKVANWQDKGGAPKTPGG